MQDMRTRIRANGISITWLADRLSVKTGKKVHQPWLANVLSGKVESIGAVYYRELVTNYLDRLERTNQFFTKD